MAGPTGPRQYALYEVNSSPLTDAILVPNLEPGQPGLIPPIPPLSFEVFPPGELAGTYRIGIACTFYREPATYWDTEIVVTAEQNNDPGQFTWRTTVRPAASTDTGSPTSLVAMLAVLAVAVSVVVYSLSRRTGRRRGLQKEPNS